MSGVESFGRLEVFQILMVGLALRGFLSSLKTMSPLFEGQLDSQEFMLPHIIVVFHCIKTFGKEGAKMNSSLLTCWLSTAPSPVLEASTSTMNCLEGSGACRIGVNKNCFLRVENSSSADSLQVNLALDYVRKCRGAETRL